MAFFCPSLQPIVIPFFLFVALIGIFLFRFALAHWKMADGLILPVADIPERAISAGIVLILEDCWGDRKIARTDPLVGLEGLLFRARGQGHEVLWAFGPSER